MEFKEFEVIQEVVIVEEFVTDIVELEGPVDDDPDDGERVLELSARIFEAELIQPLLVAIDSIDPICGSFKDHGTLNMFPNSGSGKATQHLKRLFGLKWAASRSEDSLPGAELLSRKRVFNVKLCQNEKFDSGRSKVMKVFYPPGAVALNVSASTTIGPGQNDRPTSRGRFELDCWLNGLKRANAARVMMHGIDASEIVTNPLFGSALLTAIESCKDGKTIVSPCGDYSWDKFITESSQAKERDRLRAETMELT